MKSDIMAVEDETVFSLLDAAATDVNPVTTSTTSLTRTALKDAFKEVEKHDLIVTKVVMNAQTLADIRGWDNRDFDPVNFECVAG